MSMQRITIYEIQTQEGRKVVRADCVATLEQAIESAGYLASTGEWAKIKPSIVSQEEAALYLEGR